MPTQGLPSKPSKWLYRIWPFSQLAHENSELRQRVDELFGACGREVREHIKAQAAWVAEAALLSSIIKQLRADNGRLMVKNQSLSAQIERWQKIFASKVPPDAPTTGPISRDPADFIFDPWELVGEGDQPVPDGTPIQTILDSEALKNFDDCVALAEEYLWLGKVFAYRVGTLKSEMSE